MQTSARFLTNMQLIVIMGIIEMFTGIKRTPNVQSFIEANEKSPVVEGRILSYENGGGYYRLKNGKEFRLSRDECRSLPAYYPIWHINGDY